MRAARPTPLVGSLVALTMLAACSSPLVQTFRSPAQTPTWTPDNHLVPDTTATARMATIAVSPAVRTATAVPDLSRLRGVWTAYVNDEYGFTFEYPAAYDVEPFKSWGCGIHASDNGVFFGSDNSLSVVSADGLDLGEYVDRYVQEQGSGFEAGRRETIDRNGESRGIVIDYFHRGVNHGGIAAFFQRDDNVYIFRVRLSLACSMQEIDLLSPGPFYHAVETFTFTR